MEKNFWFLIIRQWLLAANRITIQTVMLCLKCRELKDKVWLVAFTFGTRVNVLVMIGTNETRKFLSTRIFCPRARDLSWSRRPAGAAQREPRPPAAPSRYHERDRVPAARCGPGSHRRATASLVLHHDIYIGGQQVVLCPLLSSRSSRSSRSCSWSFSASMNQRDNKFYLQ